MRRNFLKIGASIRSTNDFFTAQHENHKIILLQIFLLIAVLHLNSFDRAGTMFVFKKEFNVTLRFENIPTHVGHLVHISSSNYGKQTRRACHFLEQGRLEDLWLKKERTD